MERIIAGRPSYYKNWLTGKSRLTLTYVISAIFVVVFLLFYVWCRNQVVKSGYEIGRENKANTELFQLNKKLKLEVATLKSPHYIERIARRDLGLTSPKPNQIIIIK